MVLKECFMTYNEIEKCLEFIDRIKACVTEDEFSQLLSEIKNYLGKKYQAHLIIESSAILFDVNYDDNDLFKDKNSLIAFIIGLIDADPQSSEIHSIVNLVKKGEASKGNRTLQDDFVLCVYTGYTGKITFPKLVIDFCSNPSSTKYQFMSPITTSVVDGLIQSLKNYANCLLMPSRNSKEVTKIENNFNPVNNIKIDFTITIENARSKAEEAGLSAKQLEEVNKKIDEIQSLLESKDTKNKKWPKVASVLKWITEQGIQVATFMIPLLCNLI